MFRPISTLLSSTRSAIPSVARVRHSSAPAFAGPNGASTSYIADRAAAEDYVRANGWDMVSLVEIPIEWGMHDGFGVSRDEARAN